MSQTFPLVLGRQTGSGAPSVFSATTTPAPVGSEKNPKSQLMEFFQKRQGAPQFTTTAMTKPPADPSFKCILVCPPVQSAMGNGKVIPETHFVGTGRSKKAAEQAACLEALELYRSNCLLANPRSVQQQPSKAPTSAEQSPVPSVDQPMYVQSPTPPPSTTRGSPVEYYTTPQGTGSTVQPIISEGVYGTNPAPIQFTSAVPTPQGVRTVQYVPSLHNDANDKFAVQSQMDLLSDDEEVTLDNSDYEQRREAIISSREIREVKRLAMDALDEILILRKELFDAQMSLKDKKRIGERIAESARYLMSD